MNSSDSDYEEYDLLFECQYGYVTAAIRLLHEIKYSPNYLSLALCAVARGLSEKKVSSGDAVFLTNELLERGATFTECDMFTKNTPLHYYCNIRHFVLARCAIEEGANVNAVNRYGQIPLHCFTINCPMFPSSSGRSVLQLLRHEGLDRFMHRSDSDQLFKLLLQKGANLLIRDNAGVTSLWLTPYSLLEPAVYSLLDQPILSPESTHSLLELFKLLPNTPDWKIRAIRMATHRHHCDILTILDELL
jgi:hypothetical protein